MADSEVFLTLRATLADILPEIAAGEIEPTDSLRDLGANSVDRMDVIAETLEAYDLNIPMIEFGGLSTIQEIVDVIEKHR